MKICILALTYLVNHTHHNPKIYKHVNERIVENICHYSIKRYLDPKLILALISHESAYKPRLRSKTNDVGLMQLNLKYIRSKCNPYKIRCNIKEGTYKLYIWKKAGNIGKNYWLRRYNWHSKKHHLRVLWIAEAFSKALSGHEYLLKYVKHREYNRIRINYNCIKENLCGLLRKGR
jgi:hypothetical protein